MAAKGGAAAGGERWIATPLAVSAVEMAWSEILFSEAFTGVEVTLGRVKGLGEVAGRGLKLRHEGNGEGGSHERRRGGAHGWPDGSVDQWRQRTWVEIDGQDKMEGTRRLRAVGCTVGRCQGGLTDGIGRWSGWWTGSVKRQRGGTVGCRPLAWTEAGRRHARRREMGSGDGAVDGEVAAEGGAWLMVATGGRRRVAGSLEPASGLRRRLWAF